MRYFIWIGSYMSNNDEVYCPVTRACSEATIVADNADLVCPVDSSCEYGEISAAALKLYGLVIDCETPGLEAAVIGESGSCAADWPGGGKGGHPDIRGIRKSDFRRVPKCAMVRQP